MSRGQLEALVRKSPATLARNPHLREFLRLGPAKGATKSARAACSANQWKAGWRIIGAQRIYARSRWEANYARYLEFLRLSGEIRSWRHEARTFWFRAIKRGTCSYLPDFRVKGKVGCVAYHEVKGWMDARSKTKLARMKKYHPKVLVIVIDAGWFRANGRKLRSILPGWETSARPFEVPGKAKPSPSATEELVFIPLVTIEADAP